MIARTQEETEAIAARLAMTLSPGDVVALSGPLGAGKSVFARAALRALGVKDPALPSPTFAIVHSYQGRNAQPIAHMDWYRIEAPEELAAIGVEEMLRAPWIALVEWPERAPEFIPEGAVWVTIAFAEGSAEARAIAIRRGR